MIQQSIFPERTSYYALVMYVKQDAVTFQFFKLNESFEFKSPNCFNRFRQMLHRRAG